MLRHVSHDHSQFTTPPPARATAVDPINLLAIRMRPNALPTHRPPTAVLLQVKATGEIFIRVRVQETSEPLANNAKYDKKVPCCHYTSHPSRPRHPPVLPIATAPALRVELSGAAPSALLSASARFLSPLHIAPGVAPWMTWCGRVLAFSVRDLRR